MKNNKLYVQIRSKKLGILLMDARLSKKISVEDISKQTGIAENRLSLLRIFQNKQELLKID